jgi:hypothetical protein
MLFKNLRMNLKNAGIILGSFVFIALLVNLRIQPSTQDRGELQSAAALIKKSLDEKDIEAARNQLDLLVKDKASYVFDEAEFLALGNDYLKAQKPHFAAAVFEMDVEIFPDSLSAIRLLAHSYFMSGDEERSLRTAAQMMAARNKVELADFLGKNRSSLASTAEEVIDRSLRATGGREVWQAVKTMVVIFNVQSSSGKQHQIIRMYKRPSLYRGGAKGSSNFTATDGQTLWQVSGDKWRETEDVPLRETSMDGWLLDYERVGISYAFTGFDYINGSPVYRLRRTYRNGVEEDCDFSALSNLMTEIHSDYIQGMPFMKSFMSQWNFREVDGVKIPFVFIRNMGPLGPPHGGIVEEVQINVPLEDSLFLPPDYKK